MTDLAMSCAQWFGRIVIDIPHRLMEDEIYEGYQISSGVLVFENQWAIY